jgi:hypothetical protein
MAFLVSLIAREKRWGEYPGKEKTMGKQAGTSQGENGKRVGLEFLHSNEFLFIDNRILLSSFFRVNPYLTFSL